MNYLGKKAKDKITGFEGIVVSKHEYLFGRTQYGIQSTTVVDGKEPATIYVDADRVQITGEWIDPDSDKA